MWQALAVNAPETGPPEAPRPEARWVDNDAALADVVKILLDEPSYGLDTEFLSEHTYWPRLCLVQLSWSHGIALVDPFACDVRALADVLHAPATMVTHAGASDLPILDRAIGARPAGLFDTQLAAGFVGPRVTVARIAGVGAARRAPRQVGAARRLVGASDEGLAQALRRRRRAAPAPAHRGVAAPAHRSRARAVGRDRVRGAAHERATRQRSRHRVVAGEGRVVDARREGQGRAVAGRLARTARAGERHAHPPGALRLRDRRRRESSAAQPSRTCSRCAASTASGAAPPRRSSRWSSRHARCRTTRCAAHRSSTTCPTSTPRSRCSSPGWRNSRRRSASTGKCSRHATTSRHWCTGGRVASTTVGGRSSRARVCTGCSRATRSSASPTAAADLQME